jgi:hypothetical protein
LSVPGQQLLGQSTSLLFIKRAGNGMGHEYRSRLGIFFIECSQSSLQPMQKISAPFWERLFEV